MDQTMVCWVHKRMSSVNFKGKKFLPKNKCTKKLTQCPNFKPYLPEIILFPDFFLGGRGIKCSVSSAFLVMVELNMANYNHRRDGRG